MSKSKILFISLTSIIAGLLIAVAVMAWTNPSGNPTTGGNFYYSGGNIGIGKVPGSYALDVDGAINATTYNVGANAGLSGAYSFSDIDSYTKLLVHFNGADGATSYTAETGQTATFAGTAQLDTAQKEFGTASLLLDGNSDYVTLPDSDDWHFGTGDFTIDAWVRFNDITGEQTIVSQHQGVPRFWIFTKDGSQKLHIYFTYDPANLTQIRVAEYVLTNAWSSITTNTWYHIAIVRSGATCKMFIDGVSQAVTTVVAFSDVGEVTALLNVGRWAYAGGIYSFNGWIDEFRISKGIARWTANFTPPASAYGNKTVTVTGGLITNVE